MKRWSIDLEVGEITSGINIEIKSLFSGQDTARPAKDDTLEISYPNNDSAGGVVKDVNNNNISVVIGPENWTFEFVRSYFDNNEFLTLTYRIK